MDIAVFFAVCAKVSVLYLMIFMGYIAGKFLKLPRTALSSFVFYILTPVVIFGGMMNVQITRTLALLPVIVFLLSSIISLIVYMLSFRFFHDHSRNILAYSSGSSSTGQFGLPVALLLFDIDTVAIYTVAFVGINIFENTIGFYIAAKGSFSSIECLKRIARLPSMYVIVIATILQSLGVEVNFDVWKSFYGYVRNSYVLLGMVCIGVSISMIQKFFVDWKFVIVSSLVKYVLWPSVMFGIVYFDLHYTHIYPKEVHDALFVVSIVPLSTTVAVVASVLNYPSEAVSVTVLLNILLASVYVPFMVVLLHL